MGCKGVFVTRTCFRDTKKKYFVVLEDHERIGFGVNGLIFVQQKLGMYDNTTKSPNASRTQNIMIQKTPYKDNPKDSPDFINMSPKSVFSMVIV